MVVLYTKQLAPETLIERSRQNLSSKNMKLRDHNLQSRPAGVAWGRVLVSSVIGKFDGETGQNSAIVESRYIRQ